jgi:hypothetical protein
VFPSFELQDFRQLLQLCAQARFVPDKEWLASVYYSDTGGFERLYKQVGIEAWRRRCSRVVCPSFRSTLSDGQQHAHRCQAARHKRCTQVNTACILRALCSPPLLFASSFFGCVLQEPPESLVLLLADLAAMLGSPASLLQDLAAASAQSQQQQPSEQPPPADAQQSSEAVMAAMQQASTNLQAIQQDPLLAGELSAVGGYWLLRRFLPTLHEQPGVVLTGLTALPGLGYRVSCQAWWQGVSLWDNACSLHCVHA